MAFLARNRVFIYVIHEIDARSRASERNDPCQTFQRHYKFGSIFLETSDLVIWSAVAVMIPAQIIGALSGTRAMLGRGIVLTRPLVVFICGLIAIKLASEVWLP
ncbi:hypothetical protein OA249_00640 [Litorivicinus sp.]|nr:hypothetical protein [Litorivicinus sp.]